MKKSNLQHVKTNNRGLILSCIYAGFNTRAEIVKQSGLSKAAVTLIINDFIAEGRVVEKGADIDHSVGRPAITLELVGDYCYAVGLNLARKTVSACIVNHCNETVDEVVLPIKDFKNAREILDRLWDEVLRMAKKHSIPESKFIGVGIASLAPLDYAEGVVLNPPNSPLFQYFNINEYLSRKTDLPIYLDKGSALLAIADSQLRKQRYKNAVYVVINEGIGSSVLYKNQIFRGFGGYSGEIGHMSIDSNGPICSCKNRGCLEKLVSPEYIKEKFGFEKSYAELVDLCYDRDERALEILDYIATALSKGITNAINFIDPDAIIFYGEYNYRHELLFSKIKSIVNASSMIAGIHHIDVVPSLISSKSDTTFCTAAIMKAYMEQNL